MELLCLEIMNSNHVGEYLAKPGRDMLDNEDWLRNLLDKWNLAAEFPISSHDLKVLQTLRKGMQQAVKYLNLDTAMCAKELDEINLILKDIPCQIKLVCNNGDFVIKEIPLCSGWAYVIWNIAYSFAELMSEYDTTRIKICENKDCGWIFYDESKS